MTAFALIFSPVIVVLLTTFLVAMPAIMPRGVPLGVAVPRAHLGDDAVRAAVQRFRIGELVVGAVALVAAVALALTVPVAAVIAPQLVALVLGTAVYVVTRRRIIAAKHAGAWYDDVPVRLTAEVTPPAHHRPPLLWPLLALVLLVAATAIGVALYPHLPDPYPVHFTGGGVVDRTAPKSPLAVFGLLLIGFAVAAVLEAIALIVSRSALRVVTGDADPLPAAARRRSILASLLAELGAAIGGGFALFSVVTWLAREARPLVIGAIVLMIVAIFGAVAAAGVRLAAVSRAATASSPRRAESPDDDRRWKGGIVYVDRDDPAVFVPKRFGVGWTINLGNPAGMAIAVVMLLVIAGGIVAAALGIRAR